MLKALDFYRTHLSRVLTPEKEVMFLPPNMVRKLDAVGVGNHTYLSITFGSFQEVVRYDHVEDFKQKTAYEIMSGDWSSDVCSSDLFPSHDIRNGKCSITRTHQFFRSFGKLFFRMKHFATFFVQFS